MNNWIVVIATFLAAFMLTLLPVPDWAMWMRPAWILMVLIYWTAVTPYRVNVGVAWLVGIFLDVLNGSLLGEHALALTVSVYFVARIHARFHLFPLLQQSLIVFFLVLLYQFILFCVQGFIGDLPRNWLYWSSSFTSMLLWPWVFIIMTDCRRRFRVT